MIQSPQDDESLRLKVFFFRTRRGSEPVREMAQISFTNREAHHR